MVDKVLNPGVIGVTDDVDHEHHHLHRDDVQLPRRDSVHGAGYSYYAFGSRINESTTMTEAQELLARGLEKVGYRYVWLDVGWWQGTRDATGTITVNPTQWPHGIAWLASTRHSEGPAVHRCRSQRLWWAGPGDVPQLREDIDTFAAWGVDALKVDYCGGVRLA